MLLTGCHGSDQPASLNATIAFGARDTVRFSLPATTHRCTDRRTILVEAVTAEGNGVLMRLHFRDSLVAGSYPALPPGDTSATGAVVALRYLLRDAPHGFFFDTGAVQVRRERARISGRADGSGTESGIRTPTHIEYHDIALPAGTDTVPCKFQP